MIVMTKPTMLPNNTKQSSTLIALAAINMLVAVAAGAFGAHALKTVLSSTMLATWHTAVQYQMAHALGVLFIALWLPHTRSRLALFAAHAMLAGIVLFCGSLYALALTGVRLLGAVTPVGGVAFLLGWACLAWVGWRERGHDD
jgi:uncharacterized membrane protein YgdD (TMEM256/DUF423 family)